jgi:hypothetical protein
MAQRYVLDFGSANAGQVPAWDNFKRLDTLGDLAPQPAIVEIANGEFYFDYEWATAPTGVVAITFKATCNGAERSDVITSEPYAVPGTYSTVGYQTVGPIVARALVQAGMISLTRAQILAFDPFASTDPTVVRAVELLDSLGMDLCAEIRPHLHRVLTIVTNAGATTYALPADFFDMVSDTAWNNSGVYPLAGPITPQAERFVVAWNGTSTIRIPFRIVGNRITFPIAPANGLTLTMVYVSNYWAQATASAAPDKNTITVRTDWVCFDPLLVVYGLKARVLEAEGSPMAATAFAEYEKRLETAKGAIGGAPVLSLNGGRSGFRFIDTDNLPATGWGI